MQERAPRTEQDPHGCPFATMSRKDLLAALQEVGGLSAQDAQQCAARVASSNAQGRQANAAMVGGPLQKNSAAILEAVTFKAT